MLRTIEENLNTIVIAKGEQAYVVKLNSPESFEVHVISKGRNAVIGIEELKFICGQQYVHNKYSDDQRSALSIVTYEVEGAVLADQQLFIKKRVRAVKPQTGAITRLDMIKNTSWLTLITDIRTRAIIGYYIVFHEPSALSIACSLTNAVLPKNRYLEVFGCPNVNQSLYGMPKRMKLDKSPEFKKLKFGKHCATHNINFAWQPARQKLRGGHVERLIGTMVCNDIVNRKAFKIRPNGELKF